MKGKTLASEDLFRYLQAVGIVMDRPAEERREGLDHIQAYFFRAARTECPFCHAEISHKLPKQGKPDRDAALLLNWHFSKRRECLQAACLAVAEHREKWDSAMTSAPPRGPFAWTSCGTCGKDVCYRQASRAEEHYCSEACANHAAYLAKKARRKPPEPTCAHCGKPYTPERKSSQFCSSACRQAAYRARRAGQDAHATDPTPEDGCARAAE